ncbi:MAG: NAD-dependent epimerase/dehydratase family protein [Pseudanabaenales cyanobacterium]|nr:NAD-dependent epimerase/dehydratase family protein [Pseudanabaenales cyanobacterium]
MALDMIAYTEKDAASVVNVFKGIAQRTVVISSQDVYRAYDILRQVEAGSPEPTPLTEESPLRSHYYPFKAMPQRPLNAPEDYEKILVEQRFMADPDLPSTVLRLPMVYGPNDPLRRLFPYLQRMDDRRPAIILEETYAQWRGSYGYVENVAAAIALAITDERATGRIYNVAAPSSPTEADWIKAIGQIADWPGKVIAIPKSQLPKSVEFPLNLVQDWVTDSSRIRTELGYTEPIPQAEAIQRTLVWERANPPANISQWAAPGLLDYAAEDQILETMRE